MLRAGVGPPQQCAFLRGWGLMQRRRLLLQLGIQLVNKWPHQPQVIYNQLPNLPWDVSMDNLYIVAGVKALVVHSHQCHHAIVNIYILVDVHIGIDMLNAE